MVVRLFSDIHRRANLRIDTASHFLRDLVVGPRYCLFMNGARNTTKEITMNATDFARSILASRINAAQAAGRWVTIADLRWTDAESAACRSAGIDRAECAAIVFDLFKKIEN